MPTSANCPKKPSDVRADVGIRAPILPLSQQPLTSTAKHNRDLAAWFTLAPLGEELLPESAAAQRVDGFGILRGFAGVGGAVQGFRELEVARGNAVSR